jgi:MtrB/PioB family decaheme-associated outer membrane protein
MKIKTKLRLMGVMSAVAFCAGPIIPGALAADVMPVKAMPAAEPVPFWWFHGEIEAGGRFYANHPEKKGQASLGGKSLAKYYEYNSAKPGAFMNAHLATGTSNGLYQLDLWAKNVGYDDQKFDLEASKAGEHYLSLGWDETPHFYGYGQTIYNGVGTNSLTLPSGLSNSLFNAAKTGASAPPSTLTTAQAAAVKKILDANVHDIDIGIRRDTASVEYRWTPTDAWDLSVNYSNMHRKGTQVEGVVFAPTPSGPGSQVPKPVDDTTQNFGMNGEYAGTSPWGKKYTFKVGYAGSVYTDANNSYTVEDPFCPTGAGAVGCGITSGTSPGANTALMSLWPSNQANGFNATLGADLPMKSRYVGALSYNMMRQNDNFLPFTNNTGLGVLINGQNPSSTSALPASSLNGAINTFLTNNVLTTQITSDLKSKLAYRYYDYQNNTPEYYFSNWALTDSKLANSASATYAPVRSISPQYTKQNADAGLNWRPTNQWNFGADYGFERYDWTRADVNVTNENSGKVYSDWKPASWLTARASWISSERRYDNYDYLAYVGTFQWINPGNTEQSSAMRQFYLNNRDRNKAQASVSIDVIRGLTLTPTVMHQDDVYRIASTEVGLTRSDSWKAGLEVAYVLNPATTFLFSYMNEYGSQNLRSTGATSTGALTTANTYSANIKDKVNTFIGAVNFAAIPDKLDLSLSYTVALANDSQPVYFENGALPSSGQYPDVRTTWTRLEAMAKYRFDKETLQQIGWKGDVIAKLRYAWERNSVDNWQNDSMQTYMYTAGAPGSSYGYWDWMAYDNPNYNVHMISASLTFKW